MSTSKNKWFNLFFFKEGRKILSVIVFTLLLSAFFGYVTPFLIVNLSANYDDGKLFYNSIVWLLLLFIGVYCNRLIYQLSINKYIKLFMQILRTHCFEKWILRYDKGEDEGKNRFQQGEVIARIISDTLAVRELITSGTFAIVIDSFFVLSCLVGLIEIDKISGYFFSVVILTVTLLLIWGGKYMRLIFHKVRRAKGKIYQNLSNVVGGLRESYYTEHGNYASKISRFAFDDFLHKQLRANVWDASYYSVAESFHPLLFALLVLIFPYTPIVEVAVIFAIVDIIQRAINPIKSIAGKITNIQRALTGVQMIGEFTTQLEKDVLSSGKRTTYHLDFSSMEVHIEHFSYTKKREQENIENTAFSLRNINFTAKRGELVGLVGLSGCGKSTLLNIIAANITSLMGKIILHRQGRSIYFPSHNEEMLMIYREQVGLVSQDSHIFSESLLFNITLQLERDHHFDSFWKWVCEKIPYLQYWGVSPSDIINPRLLSLGQIQLICALRACFLKKGLVLFDEISSGMDSELEEALRSVILLIQKKSLTIIVAHRLETLICAEQLILIDKGRIMGMGTHQKLLKNTIYKSFVDQLHRDAQDKI